MFWPFSIFLINLILISMGRERFALALGILNLIVCLILLFIHATTPLQVIL